MREHVTKDMHLIDELRVAFSLIEIGFGEFQNIDSENDFYYLPFQLVSSGFERLMKCHICLGCQNQNNAYPDNKYLKKCGGKSGHDLSELKENILSDFFTTDNIPALAEDHDFLANDNELQRLMYLLSEFGKYARYYNFDVLTSASKPSIDVASLWADYENSVIQSNPDLLAKVSSLESQDEVFQAINRRIIISFEKFVRAIARQFTIGRLGAKAKQVSSILYPFIMLGDDQLGSIDYRNRTTRRKEEKRRAHKRTIWDKIRRRFSKEYKHLLITRGDYDGKWPFYHDEVVIECRAKHWCIVTIDGKDYALNGAAKSRYKLEDVHEAGVAVLGESVGPFIDAALKLK